MYRHEVQGLTVLAIGPRGGKRWIASYSSKTRAERVARMLNQAEAEERAAK